MTDKNSDLPALGYAGTSGWSGSNASKARQAKQDADGTTTARQKLALTTLASRGAHGVTWRELADLLDWHHGQATGMLSNLHKKGHITRLAEGRDHCSIYVLLDHVNGRPTVAHGRKGTNPSSIKEEHAEMKAKLEKVEELVRPKFRSYSYTREHLLEDLQRVVL